MGLGQFIRRLFDLGASPAKETMWDDPPAKVASPPPVSVTPPPIPPPASPVSPMTTQTKRASAFSGKAIRLAAATTAASCGTLWSDTSDEPKGRQDRPVKARMSHRINGSERFDLNELARRLGMGLDELQRVEVRYREFGVPKRTGGMRWLADPNAALKAVQRRILHRLLRRLRAHDAARGYERGRSIVDNARPHCRAAVVLKMDIREFFHSTAADRVRAYFQAIGWKKPAADLLTKLCTHENRLPQGAPTSPRLSNLVNFHLDARLSALAGAFGGQYTRYADDMTFSLPTEDREGLRAFIRVTKDVCRETGYTLHQKRKLQVRRAHERQQVTGLVVNDRANLPRRTRRWLRAVEHRIATGRPSTLTARQLQGWHALRRMLEQAT